MLFYEIVKKMFSEFIDLIRIPVMLCCMSGFKKGVIVLMLLPSFQLIRRRPILLLLLFIYVVCVKEDGSLCDALLMWEWEYLIDTVVYPRYLFYTSMHQKDINRKLRLLAMIWVSSFFQIFTELQLHFRTKMS